MAAKRPQTPSGGDTEEDASQAQAKEEDLARQVAAPIRVGVDDCRRGGSAG